MRRIFLVISVVFCVSCARAAWDNCSLQNDTGDGSYFDGYPPCPEYVTHQEHGTIRKVYVCPIQTVTIEELKKRTVDWKRLECFADRVINPSFLIEQLSGLKIPNDKIPRTIDLLSAGHNTSQWLVEIGILAKK